MLAMGRALMLNPKLLLLDEPLEGLAPVIVVELSRAIDAMVTREGQALVLVEQHADQALALTHRAIVLERGRIVHEGASDVLRADRRSLDRWIGVRVAPPLLRGEGRGGDGFAAQGNGYPSPSQPPA